MSLKNAVISVRASRVLKWLKTFLGIAWLVSCNLVLATILYLAEPGGSDELEKLEIYIFLFWTMNILSFPAGFLVNWLMIALSWTQQLYPFLDDWVDNLVLDMDMLYISVFFYWALFLSLVISNGLSWFHGLFHV